MNNKQNILIVGNGAVSFALAKKISTYENSENIFVTSKNNYINNNYKCIDIREDNSIELLKFAIDNNINLTIVTSEKAIKSDIATIFQNNGQRIFAPSAETAEPAINKIIGKRLLYKIRTKTQKFGIFDKLSAAEEWLKSAQFPVIIRCEEYDKLDDRLVCTNPGIATAFLNNMQRNNNTNYLIEEYIHGHNFTIYFITDGYSAIPLPAAAAYKFMAEGDGGIYTSGMGSFSPDYKITNEIYSYTLNIINDIINLMNNRYEPYVGIIGLDCTLCQDNSIYVNELVPFLQDFDATTVLNCIEENLIDIFGACVDGLFSDEYEDIIYNNSASVSAVVLSKFSESSLDLNNSEEIRPYIDFINIIPKESYRYICPKGFSFVLTKSAGTLNRARTYLYENLSEIKFDGMYYRKDICK